MRECGCVVVDVTELTPFVEAEVALAIATLREQRVLFVGDDSLSRSDWQRQITAILHSYDIKEMTPADINVAIWTTDSAFRLVVREFKDRLSTAPYGKGLNSPPECELGNIDYGLGLALDIAGFVLAVIAVVALPHVLVVLVVLVGHLAIWVGLIVGMCLLFYLVDELVSFVHHTASPIRKLLIGVLLPIALVWHAFAISTQRMQSL